MNQYSRRAGGKMVQPLRGHYRMVVRELALGLSSYAEIAKKYNVHASSVSRFAKTHAYEVDELRRALGDAVLERLAGMWITDQGSRLRVYQEIADRNPDDKVVVAVLHAVAEELGQLPPRNTVVVMPVTHVVEGVDMDALK